ncbi:MAG: hypothetical protein ACE5D4_09760, partial [Thermodesulfobacteriota bacterium]
MVTVTIREAIRLTLEARKLGQSVLLMGSPGIGKTSVPRACTEILRADGVENPECHIHEASSLNPTDSKGVPFIWKGVSDFGRPAILPKNENGQGFVVIDEVASCNPMTQTSLYPLFQERRLATYTLGKGWTIVGTGNFSTDSSFATKISDALSDRGMLLNPVANYQEWKQDYAIPNGINHKILGYLNSRPNKFYTFNDRLKQTKANPGAKSYSSPRSWELASGFIDITETTGNTFLAGLASYMGESDARDFKTHLDFHDKMPSIQAIIRGKCKDVPDEPDILWAATGALPAAIDNIPRDLSKAMVVSNIFDYIGLLPAEFAVITVEDMLRKEPSITKDPTMRKAWMKWASSHREVIL